MTNSQIDSPEFSSQLNTQTLPIELSKIDSALSELLGNLENTLFEDDESDTLVSKLQESIGARQILIAQIVKDDQFQDRSYLQQLAEHTQSIESRARKVLADREALLGALRKGRRQTNLYKTIGSNR